jgi:hypothetical protein
MISMIQKLRSHIDCNSMSPVRYLDFDNLVLCLGGSTEQNEEVWQMFMKLYRIAEFFSSLTIA